MQFVLPDAIIVEAFPSQDGAKVYIEVRAASGKFKLTLDGRTMSDIEPMLRERVTLRGQIEGRLWGVQLADGSSRDTQSLVVHGLEVEAFRRGGK